MSQDKDHRLGVRNILKISETPLITETLEGLIVSMQCLRTRTIVLVYVIYCLPSSSMSNAFLDDLGSVLRVAATHPNEAMICGDFNVHYTNVQSTTAGNGVVLLVRQHRIRPVSE